MPGARGHAGVRDRQLAPGDLLFGAGSDGTAANPGHVGMYMGSGLVIEAPQTGEPIMITPLAGYWQQNTVVIRGLFTPAEEGKPTLGIDRSCRTLPNQAHPFALPARGKPARFMT